MKTTIYRRVFVPFAAAVTCVTVAGWWLASTLVASTLETRLQTRLDYSVNLLASRQLPITPELVQQLADLQNMSFVVQRDETTLITTPASTTPTQRSQIAEFADDLLDETAGPRASNEQFRVSHQRVETAGNGPMSILGLADLAHVQAAARELALTFGVAGLLLLGILWVVGHYSSRTLNTSIQALVQRAGRIATGERDRENTDSAIEEIATLHAALSDMGELLGQYEAAVAERHRLQGLGELAARVAHEIRNPLTAMKLHLQLLAEDTATTDAHETVALLLTETQRLQFIVDATLNRAQATPDEVSAIDTETLLSEVVTLLTPQFEHRGVRVETQFESGLKSAIAADALKQVIFNVLSNAADAMPEGGNIRIITTHGGDEAQIVIEDEGPGLDPQSPDLFSARRSTKSNGLGIGLALSHDIITTYGGTIEALRGETLKGARFVITLPASCIDSHRQTTDNSEGA